MGTVSERKPSWKGTPKKIGEGGRAERPEHAGTGDGFWRDKPPCPKGAPTFDGEGQTSPSGVGFWRGCGSPVVPGGWILAGRSSHQDPAPGLEGRGLSAELPGRGGAWRGVSGDLPARAPMRLPLPARIQAGLGACSRVFASGRRWRSAGSPFLAGGGRRKRSGRVEPPGRGDPRPSSYVKGELAGGFLGREGPQLARAAVVTGLVLSRGLRVGHALGGHRIDASDQRAELCRHSSGGEAPGVIRYSQSKSRSSSTVLPIGQDSSGPDTSMR